jgi:hypothetical protein
MGPLLGAARARARLDPDGEEESVRRTRRRRLRRRWSLPVPSTLHRPPLTPPRHRRHRSSPSLRPRQARPPGTDPARNLPARAGEAAPAWFRRALASAGGADATSPSPRHRRPRKHVAVVVRSTPTPGPTTTGVRDLRRGGKTTHLCVTAQLVPKMVILFASAVGDCF